MTSPTRDDLAAAGWRVEPLVWSRGCEGLQAASDYIAAKYQPQGRWHDLWFDTPLGIFKTAREARASCQAHHVLLKVRHGASVWHHTRHECARCGAVVQWDRSAGRWVRSE